MDRFTNKYCNDELALMCKHSVQNDSSDMCHDALEAIIIRNDQIEKLVDALEDCCSQIFIENEKPNEVESYVISCNLLKEVCGES